VVVVDGDQSFCEALQRLLATLGLKARTFGAAQEFMSAKRLDVLSWLVLGTARRDSSEPSWSSGDEGMMR